MKLPRKKQKYPELWLWDYSENKHNPGFGVIIAHEDGVCEVLHFNKHWDGGAKYRSPNTKKDDFQPSPLRRDGLLSETTFKFHCELI